MIYSPMPCTRRIPLQSLLQAGMPAAATERRDAIIPAKFRVRIRDPLRNKSRSYLNGIVPADTSSAAAAAASLRLSSWHVLANRVAPGLASGSEAAQQFTSARSTPCPLHTCHLPLWGTQTCSLAVQKRQSL